MVIFAAIVMMTPVKSLVFDKEKKKANPAADLSADRIEQIADSLSQARINELLRQLEALQAVLHNMDLMKEELQKEDTDVTSAVLFVHASDAAGNVGEAFMPLSLSQPQNLRS